MKSYVIIDSSNLIFSGIYACMTKAGISPLSSMEQYFSTRLMDIAMVNSKLLNNEDVPTKFIFVEDGYKGNTKKSNILREVTGEGYKANRDASVEITEYRESADTLIPVHTRKKIDFDKGKQALYNVIGRLVKNSSSTVNIITEEADDIIASIVHKIKQVGEPYKILILSADVDILQLSDSENIFQYSHIRRAILDLDYLKHATGLNRFKDIVTYKTFLGDAGDNINVKFCSVKGKIRAAATTKIINENPDKSIDDITDIIEKNLQLDNPINRDHLYKINSIVKLSTEVPIEDSIIDITINKQEQESDEILFI